MHHSDNPYRQSFAVTCYLDESGTDINSSQAVVAGLLFKKDNFIIFDWAWEEILMKHNIESPLHMREFGKHGRHGHLSYDQREILFDQLVRLINSYKIHSVAMSLNQEDYLNSLDKNIRKMFSLYGACFMGCAHLVTIQANYQGYSKNIEFILEDGNEFRDHILKSHAQMIRLQKENIMSNVGTVAFGNKKISALQAADVIAWAVRRKVSGEPIHKGHEPIIKIFSENHIEASWKNIWLQNLNRAIMNKTKDQSS